MSRKPALFVRTETNLAVSEDQNTTAQSSTRDKTSTSKTPRGPKKTFGLRASTLAFEDGWTTFTEETKAGPAKADSDSKTPKQRGNQILKTSSALSSYFSERGVALSPSECTPVENRVKKTSIGGESYYRRMLELRDNEVLELRSENERLQQRLEASESEVKALRTEAQRYGNLKLLLGEKEKVIRSLHNSLFMAD